MSREHDPQDKENATPGEQLREESILGVLISVKLGERAEISRIWVIHVVVIVIGIVIGRVREASTSEGGCQETERESTDPERESESLSKAEPSPILLPLRSGTLTLGPWWGFTPGVLPAAPSTVHRDYILLAYPSFAHGTQRSLRTHLVVADLQPPVETRPAEEVSAQANDRITGRVQTDIALKVVG